MVEADYDTERGAGMIRYEKQPIATVAVHYCDVCDRQSKCPRRCRGCNVDICSECGVVWLCDPFDGDDNGEHLPIACRPCNKLAVEYGVKTKAIIAESEQRVDAIKAEWKAKCNKSPIETK